MPQPNYNLHLKGYVGGCDFDRNYVDYVLAKNKDKPVHVLIDSLGEEGYSLLLGRTGNSGSPYSTSGYHPAQEWQWHLVTKAS